MKKLLILALVLSPLLSFAHDYSTEDSNEPARRRPYPPGYSNYCGSFSDGGCWGRPIGSFCVKYGGRYTQNGTCYPSGFRDARGEYSCRCF
jgi:hypothetical protein